MLQSHSNHGFRLENGQDSLDPEKSFMSCHSRVGWDAETSRVVSYVKSQCDSGFVCTEMTRTSTSVLTARFGPKARSPGEACSSLYFSPSVTRTVELVPRRSPVEPCSLAGRYQLQLLRPRAPAPLSHCPAPGALHLSAGCGSSSLTVESECGAGNLTRSSYSCHAAWTEEGRSHLILREDGADSAVCLTYADKQLSVSWDGCRAWDPVYSIAETGLCLQALSSHPVSSSSLPSSLPSSLSSLLVLSRLYLDLRTMFR